MAEYFVEEGEIITIRIIQENDLEFAQDFNVILRLNSGSNASEGKYYHYICLQDSYIAKV